MLPKNMLMFSNKPSLPASLLMNAARKTGVSDVLVKCAPLEAERLTRLCWHLGTAGWLLLYDERKATGSCGLCAKFRECY